MPDTRISLAVLSLAFLLPALSACTTTGFAVGASAGATVAASQERGLAGTLKDTRIRAAINILWLKQNSDMYQGLGLAVHEGRVLVTGVVRSEEQRADAVRLAWRATGVIQAVDVRMQVAHLDTNVPEVVRQLLGTALGQGGDQHPFM